MTTIWDKNGHISIPVTQEHIDASMARSSSHCMTALAIQKAIPDARHICVDLQTIRWTRKGLRYVFLTPHVAQDKIIAFDQGERVYGASRIAKPWYAPGIEALQYFHAFDQRQYIAPSAGRGRTT